MPVPQSLMRMDTLRFMNTHKCEHGHSYLSHSNCYIREIEGRKRVGYFDIESSSLVADFGINLSWCILGSDNQFHGRILTREELLAVNPPDQFLMKELVDELYSWDLLYGYNSTNFDFPFVRTRCAINNIPFPVYGSLKHKDVYYIIKSKFRMHRKSQEVAAETILGQSNKTHWMAKYWVKAIQGDQIALDYIWDHNKKDCQDLKAITERVIDYVQPVERSI